MPLPVRHREVHKARDVLRFVDALNTKGHGGGPRRLRVSTDVHHHFTRVTIRCAVPTVNFWIDRPLPVHETPSS